MAEEKTEFKTKSDLYETELRAAKKELERWQETATRVVKRYLGGKTQNANSTADGGGVFNLFWSNINILKAALYAKQPRADVSRRHKDATDDVARVGGLIIERILNLDMDARSSDFDQSLRHVIEDRLVPGMGQLWLRYDPTFIKQQMQPVIDPQTGVTLAEGGEHEVIGDEHVATDYVYWKDFLYSPARIWRDVRWVARGVWMTREALKGKFGSRIGGLVPLTNSRGSRNTLPENDPWSKAQVWEIWNKETRYVCWKVLGFDELLGEQQDPLGLTDFFPCPKPLIANTTTTGFVPKADYQMLRDQYVELDVVSARIALLEDAIRVAGVYDKASTQLSQLISNRIQNVMIPADNWAMFAERGGIKGAVDWFPLDQVTNALQQLRDVKNSLMQDLYNLTGLSDIMRGATQASETATAQQLKAQYGSVRMQFMQGELAEFVQTALSIKAEIMASHFQPETLIRRSLIDKTPDAQYAQAAVAMLKDKSMAIYSLSVDPDTMALTDYAMEQDARVQCITAIGQFMQAAWPLAQAKPEAAPFLMQVMQWLLAGFKAGKSIEGVLDQAIAAMGNAPPAPPKPDPAMEKVHADIQSKQLKTQSDIQNDRAKTANEIQLERARSASEARARQMKSMGEAQLAGLPEDTTMPPVPVGPQK